MIDLTLENNFIFDSRKVTEGSIFIAISSANRDGNDFAKEALNKGAKFLILSKNPPHDIPQNLYLVVEDTLAFISILAKNKLEKMKREGVKTICLTGSFGKTTTKDFLHFLIKKTGAKVYASEGNFNNHIGVPISILNAPSEIDFLILEMGMNHVGEISHLVKIASCDIRIITNIASAHLGNFEEGLIGIAKTKAEILQNSSSETAFITTKNLLFLESVIKDFTGTVNYSFEILNYKILDRKTFFEINGSSYFLNKIVTKNWLENISIGLKTLQILKLDLPTDISGFALPEGRGDETKISHTCILIDESYNASPETVLNAISTLSLLSGKKLLVLGGMKELGEESFKFHLIVLRETLKHPEIETIFLGNEFKEVIFNMKIKTYKWFETPEDLIKNHSLNHDFNFILVKSSQSANTSKFSDFLKKSIN